MVALLTCFALGMKAMYDYPDSASVKYKGTCQAFFIGTMSCYFGAMTAMIAESVIACSVLKGTVNLFGTNKKTDKRKKVNVYVSFSL